MLVTPQLFLTGRGDLNILKIFKNLRFVPRGFSDDIIDNEEFYKLVAIFASTHQLWPMGHYVGCQGISKDKLPYTIALGTIAHSMDWRLKLPPTNLHKR